MVKVGQIAIDRTNIRVNANRHRTLRYQELQDEEQRLAKIRAAKQRLEEAAEQAAEQARETRTANGGKHADNASRKRYQVAAARPVEKQNPQNNLTNP